MVAQAEYRFLSAMPMGSGASPSAYVPADEFVERAGHDLAVYLCDWVVANTDVAQWLLTPQSTCTVVLPSGNELDPYRHVGSA